jgi:anti-anti-sigma factor
MEIISLGGELSRQNEQVLWNQVYPALAHRSGKILLDFTNVQYMAISSIAVLIDLLVLAKHNSIDISVCGLAKPMLELFRLTNLDEYIEIYCHCEEAFKL